MIIPYLETLIYPYVPLDGPDFLSTVDWFWIACALFILFTLHFVLRLLTIILRRILSK